MNSWCAYLQFLYPSLYRIVYLVQPFQMTFSTINQAFIPPNEKRARDMFMQQQLIKWVDLRYVKAVWRALSTYYLLC